MFIKVYVVNFLVTMITSTIKEDFDYHQRELAEYGEHQCAPMEEEATWGEDSSPYWEA